MIKSEEILQRFHRIKMLMDATKSKAFKDTSLSSTEVRILLKIPLDEEITPTRLSELTNFSNTLITFSADSLEEKGLIERNRGTDKRTIKLKLTEKGRLRQQMDRKEFNENFDRMISKLSDQELEDMIKSFDAVILYLQKLVDS
jgi:DNA-binding MarR family transcriptional regulator